jgi:Integrase core domain
VPQRLPHPLGEHSLIAPTRRGRDGGTAVTAASAKFHQHRDNLPLGSRLSERHSCGRGLLTAGLVTSSPVKAPRWGAAPRARSTARTFPSPAGRCAPSVSRSPAAGDDQALIGFGAESVARLSWVPRLSPPRRRADPGSSRPRRTDAHAGSHQPAGWEYVTSRSVTAPDWSIRRGPTRPESDNVIGFLTRAVAFYSRHGIIVEQLLTDNGGAYRSTTHTIACHALGVRHLRTRACRPQTKGALLRLRRSWSACEHRARSNDGLVSVPI